jgi:hypothetical protein
MTYIYIIGNRDSLQKIGYAINPAKRLKQLQTGNPEELFLHHKIEVPDDRARLIEQHIHREINYKRTKGEWFKLSPKEAIALLNFAAIRWVDDQML